MERASETELEIMRVIWSGSGSGVLFSDIQMELDLNGIRCTKNALTVLLSRLQKKKYLKARKQGRRNLYEALVSEETFQQEQTQVLIDRAYGGRPWDLVAHLVSGDALTEEEYAELKKILDERETPT